ncbi:phage baseplate assembly protein V [Tumebacillus lipolyticus]|uniref:Phage baseplate assembly protein V n=1 Tax=Tumebacillus lipolyticus TaxID=1280370 RepID=A0ABW5A0Y4_9BACL
MINSWAQAPSNHESRNYIHGVVRALVTDNKDPENLGRVKLTIPIREGEEVTEWAYVACMMAGKERGSVFVPEVDDEVLVAFHNGDMAEPYVIGALWNPKDKPPKYDAEKNNLRRIVSRAGHEITFDDTDKEGKIEIKTSKSHQVILDDKADTLTVADGKGKNSIVINGGDSGKITIKSSGGANATITLTAQGEIQIESAKSISVKSAQVNLEASGMMGLKATGNLTLESSAMVTIKGTMVKIN